MGVFSDLFGGTDSKALDAQAETNTATRQQLAQLAEAARADVLNLFPASELAQQQGFQGALNVLGGALPEQVSAFQQGSLGAQKALGQGLAGINAALLGLPMDLSAQNLAQRFQSPIDVDTSFAQQQVPSFFMSDELGLNPNLPAPVTAGQPAQTFQNALGGVPRETIRDQQLDKALSGGSGQVLPQRLQERGIQQISQSDDSNQSKIARAVEFIQKNNVSPQLVADQLGIDVELVNRAIAKRS